MGHGGGKRERLIEFEYQNEWKRPKMVVHMHIMQHQCIAMMPEADFQISTPSQFHFHVYHPGTWNFHTFSPSSLTINFELNIWTRLFTWPPAGTGVVWWTWPQLRLGFKSRSVICSKPPLQPSIKKNTFYFPGIVHLILYQSKQNVEN